MICCFTGCTSMKTLRPKSIRTMSCHWLADECPARPRSTVQLHYFMNLKKSVFLFKRVKFTPVAINFVAWRGYDRRAELFLFSGLLGELSSTQPMAGTTPQTPRRARGTSSRPLGDSPPPQRRRVPVSTRLQGIKLPIQTPEELSEE